MTTWLLSIAAGIAAAMLQYGVRPRGLHTLAALRAAAVSLVIALLLDAPAGARVLPSPEVALDASTSWTRASGGCPAWRVALDSAARLGGGGWTSFGDSVRAGTPRDAASDNASRVQPVVERASATGRPAIVISDGDLDDAASLAALPAGSRVIVIPCAPAPDLAVMSVDAPRTVMGGDTIAVRVTLASGGAGARATTLSLRLDDAVLAATEIAAMAPFSERAWEARGVARGARHTALLRLALAPGDAESRNDTLIVPLEVSSTPSAVFASTTPDFDAREAAAALRGATSKATRIFFRVAPGSWRLDGTLAAVTEAEVRRAVRESPLVVLHGDTTVFGAPRAATSGALLLLAPPQADDGEYFAELPRGATSPLAAMVSAIPFDSLPPLSVSARVPPGEWTALGAHRGGVAEDRRAMIVGTEQPRRTVVVAASGLWRWRFRGGVRADAYAALMGSIYDWLAAGPQDRRPVSPASALIREGMPLQWQRGAAPDSVVRVSLGRRGDPGRTQSVTLRFEKGSTTAESPPLARGVYDLRMPGGTSVLVVNATRELLPRRASVRTTSIEGSASAGVAPALRSHWWAYALVIALLSTEWILRRRQGLR